jgi:hypothetical protein
MSRTETYNQEKPLLDRDEVEGVLSGSFYSPPPALAKLRDDLGVKPSHYKVICISMYTGDLKKMDAMVDELKARGLTKTSRSALIRYALSLVDVEKVPRGL